MPVIFESFELALAVAWTTDRPFTPFNSLGWLLNHLVLRDSRPFFDRTQAAQNSQQVIRRLSGCVNKIIFGSKKKPPPRPRIFISGRPAPSWRSPKNKHELLFYFKTVPGPKSPQSTLWGERKICTRVRSTHSRPFVVLYYYYNIIHRRSVIYTHTRCIRLSRGLSVNILLLWLFFY